MDFILYAAIYRLAVIAAGTACIFMGYRLFVLGVMPQDGSQIDASAGEIRLSLKNAAPGTCFALFGTIVVGLMIWQGNPELQRTETSQSGDRVEVSVRGGGNSEDVAEQVRAAKAQEDRGDLDAAILTYAAPLSNPSLTLSEAAGPLTGLASAYRRQKRYGEALAYARLASLVLVRDPRIFEMIAQIELDRGNVETAIEFMTFAAELDPELQGELVRLRDLHDK